MAKKTAEERIAILKKEIDDLYSVIRDIAIAENTTARIIAPDKDHSCFILTEQFIKDNWGTDTEVKEFLDFHGLHIGQWVSSSQFR